MFASDAHAAANLIQQKINQLTPRLALILGSGLGEIATAITDPVIIDYESLPGFFHTTVSGHPGRLILGKLNNYPIACLQGRGHLYEGTAPATILSTIRTLKLLGCTTLLITNSAGSLHENMPTGNLMAISDHINFQFSNPLVGIHDEFWGTNFVALENAYDSELRKQLKNVAQKNKITLHEGVYIGVLGPSFETPAEIRAFKILGADAVGMSTIPEVIAARQANMKVIAISAITNLAAGMHSEKLSHQQTLRGAAQSSDDLKHLIVSFIGSFKE